MDNVAVPGATSGVTNTFTPPKMPTGPVQTWGTPQTGPTTKPTDAPGVDTTRPAGPTPANPTPGDPNN